MTSTERQCILAGEVDHVGFVFQARQMHLQEECHLGNIEHMRHFGVVHATVAIKIIAYYRKIFLGPQIRQSVKHCTSKRYSGRPNDNKKTIAHLSEFLGDRIRVRRNLQIQRRFSVLGQCLRLGEEDDVVREKDRHRRGHRRAGKVSETHIWELFAGSFLVWRGADLILPPCDDIMGVARGCGV